MQHGDAQEQSRGGRKQNQRSHCFAPAWEQDAQKRAPAPACGYPCGRISSSQVFQANQALPLPQGRVDQLKPVLPQPVETSCQQARAGMESPMSSRSTAYCFTPSSATPSSSCQGSPTKRHGVPKRAAWADLEDDAELFVGRMYGCNVSEIDTISGSDELTETGSESDFSASSAKRRSDYYQYGVPLDQACTLMIKNIPCRCTQEELLEALAELGFAGAFEFFYLPFRRSQKQGFGYAFIGFADRVEAASFSNAICGYKFPRRSCSKTIMVVPAHIQGLEHNLKNQSNQLVLGMRALQSTGLIYNVPHGVDVCYQDHDGTIH